MPIALPLHGALGIFDELIFLSVAIIFLVMMVVSWVRGRGLDDTPPQDPTPIDAPAESSAEPNRFRLD